MYFNVRGGAGDITKANTSARLQDNLYLAVNSEWLEKAKYHLIVQEPVHLMGSILILKRT